MNKEKLKIEWNLEANPKKTIAVEKYCNQKTKQTQNVTEEDNFFKASKVNCTHQMSGMPRNQFVMNSCINSSTQLLLSV